MTQLEGTAVVADLYISGKRNGVVSPAHAAARLGSTFFRDSHEGLRSVVELEFFKDSESWIHLIFFLFLKKDCLAIFFFQRGPREFAIELKG